MENIIDDYLQSEQYNEILDSLFHKSNRIRKKSKQPIKRIKMKDEEQTCSGEGCKIKNNKRQSYHNEQLDYTDWDDENDI